MQRAQTQSELIYPEYILKVVLITNHDAHVNMTQIPTRVHLRKTWAGGLSGDGPRAGRGAW